MFKKILIANRGEIACRIIRSARAMGIATVAVYSDADKDALHVEMADEAVNIGPPPAAQSYLVMDNIIAACRQTGAEAVHPGYGFLSENAAFAQALAAEDIIFIGPPVRAIEVMGDKIASKKFAEAAGVSTIPGHAGEVENAEDALAIAREIGFPVMIKASAGGGGKGMRVARTADEVAEGFKASRSEAKASFGDDRIFMEKYIEEPRHIEIQLLADSHGNVIHLNERECSVQRRNQKVVEEAPSAFVDEKMRERMGAQAVALARAVGYESAGTVEFIADRDHNFYFLEMNTRLQVEHPVTELITGVDLVEQMIRIAAGEPLELTQDDIGINGWAIECRIYAEDPYRSFLPSTGRLVYYRPPREHVRGGVRVRNDTGVYEGGEISIHYDPMIAKLCTHALGRKSAIQAMSRALDRFTIVGISHNIPFLSALMRHPRWLRARLNTNFIADEYPDGFGHTPPDGAMARKLAAIATMMDRIGNDRKRRISGQLHRNRVRFAEDRIVDLEGNTILARIEDIGKHRFVVRILSKKGRKKAELTLKSRWRPGLLVWTGRVDGVETAVQVRPILNGYSLAHHDVAVKARVYTPREAELSAKMPVKPAPDTSQFLLCPMPGLIKSIAVKEGQKVQAGETLCVVEAMKMENILRAEKDGTVEKLHAAEGDNLAVDDIIMSFA